MGIGVGPLIVTASRTTGASLPALALLAHHLLAAIRCQHLSCSSTDQDCRILVLSPRVLLGLCGSRLTGLPICAGVSLLGMLGAIGDLQGIGQRGPLIPLLRGGRYRSSLFIQYVDVLCRLGIVGGHSEDLLPSCLIIADFLVGRVGPHAGLTGHSVTGWVRLCFVAELVGCKLLSTAHLGTNRLKVIIEFIV